jgi:hypothetical protein
MMDSLYAFKCKCFHNTRHTLHLDYYCKALFETPCITIGSHIEPYLSKEKLGVF